MKKTLLLFTFILFASVGMSQNATIRQNSEFRQTMQNKAREDVQKLKDGVVLVRIHGRTQEIAYHREHDRMAVADRIEKQTRAFNQDLITAFRKHYKFCPVYFFEDTFSTCFTTGRLSEVIFYNDSLQPDSSIRFNNNNYFFMEIGFTEGDTTKFRNEYMITSNDQGTHRETRMYSEENLHLLAFVIRDKNFVMLHEPFPYYERLYKKQPKAWKLRKKIFNWNRRITNYYGG
jgi:hypothetical protein